jgi:Na+-driven multidrug efflux pump
MELITVVAALAAKMLTRKIIKITWWTLALISGTIFIFKVPLIGFFNLSPDALEAAKIFVTIHCVSMTIGWTFSFALPNALRAAGDVTYVLIVSVISMWTIRVSAAYLFTFTFGLGPAGVWLAMSVDFFIRGACYYTRWSRGKWQNKKVIEG